MAEGAHATLTSKLPGVGSTIFSTMSALAVEKQAINLGQGFPDFAPDPVLLAEVNRAMAEGYHQYPPMPGLPILRARIADMLRDLYGQHYDANSEITITAGATQALLTIFMTMVHAGDEVIVIEPAYDSYVPAIRLCGGVPVFVQMEVNVAGFSIPWDKVEAAITTKTRMLVVNSPHNPTASVLSEADLDALSALVARHPIWIASDEVYEHMVYDGVRHASLARRADLAARSFIVSSFGKTCHVTGWKIGYVAAPATLMAEFRKLHQYSVFSVNPTMQAALANYLATPGTYRDLPAFYQQKRDLFRAGLQGSRLRLLPSAGTYFQCVDYSAVSNLPELEFARWLTAEVGVAAIPASAFYHDSRDSKIVRFCFAKQTETLDAALAKLREL